MSLPPGTRVPTPGEDLWKCFEGGKAYAELTRGPERSYYRGLLEGLTLGAIAGGMAALCALSLAWAHMGG